MVGKDNTLPLLDPREPPELTGTKPASKVWAKEFSEESKRLWELAGPAIFTAISQYSLGALTQTFSGRLGELELAAVSVENSVISGLAFGVMVCYVHVSHSWYCILCSYNGHTIKNQYFNWICFFFGFICIR